MVLRHSGKIPETVVGLVRFSVGDIVKYSGRLLSNTKYIFTIILNLSESPETYYRVQHYYNDDELIHGVAADAQYELYSEAFSEEI